MRIVMLAAVLVLAACGGSGGGGGSGSGPAPMPGVLGSRAVPGCTVTVQQTTATAFSIAAMPGVQSVDVLIGADYAIARPVAMAVAANGTWSGNADPGSMLLVRLTMADGSLIETASGDFVLR